MNTKCIKALCGWLNENFPAASIGIGVLFGVNFFTEKASWYELALGIFLVILGVAYWRRIGGWGRMLGNDGKS